MSLAGFELGTLGPLAGVLPMEPLRVDFHAFGHICLVRISIIIFLVFALSTRFIKFNEIHLEDSIQHKKQNIDE